MPRRLHEARLHAGLSRLDLSRATGIAVRTINYYEDTSYRRARKRAFVQAWADATGVPFGDLWVPGDQPRKSFPWMSDRPTWGTSCDLAAVA